MSTTSSNPTNRDWLRKLITGQPHQVIPNRFGGPYLRRWYLIPRNPFINVYLHHFLSSDDDRALHDHPWWFVSLILRGGYIEIGESADGKMTALCRTAVTDIRSPFWRRCIAFRPATHRHRVVLATTQQRDDVPCWTLIVTGRRSRTWGFWCQLWNEHGFSGRGTSPGDPVQRFVPWDEFGNGGCGETA
ncbi:hypothetical protein [Mycolicibacterium porcinum]